MGKIHHPVFLKKREFMLILRLKERPYIIAMVMVFWKEM